MYKKYAVPLCTLLTVLFTLSGTGVSQQQQFIIGGDWIRQPPISSPQEAVPRSWWTFAREAGLDFAFVYTNEDSNRIGHDQLEQARVTEMKAVTGFYESPVPQDYKRFIAGRRWRCHPEDSMRYPPSQSEAGQAYSDDQSSYPEQDASQYGRTSLNSWSIPIGASGYAFRGLQLDTNFRQAKSHRLTARIRLRLPDAPLDGLTQVGRVVILDGGRFICDTIITGDWRKRTSSTPTDSLNGLQLSSDPNYGEIAIASWQHDSDLVDIRFIALGEANVLVDFVAIDDEYADSLFSGRRDSLIDLRRARVNGVEALGYFKAGDEPDVLQWPLVGYLAVRYASTEATTDDPVQSIAWVWHVHEGKELRAALEMKLPHYAIDVYMSESNPMNLDEDGLLSYQDYVKQVGVNHLRASAIMLRDTLNKPLWTMIRISNWRADSTHSAPEPWNAEIRMNANLCLCYGSKAMWYWPIHYHDSTACGLFNSVPVTIDRSRVPRTVTSNGEDKYEFIKALNTKIHQLGSTLVTLNWKDAVSTYEWNAADTTARTPRFSLYGGLQISNAVSRSFTGTLDNIRRYQHLEIGWLQGPQPDYSEYLYITNRRVAPADARIITIPFVDTMGARSAFCVENILTGDMDIYQQPYDSLTITLPPGDGALLRIDTNSLCTDRTLRGTATVHRHAKWYLENMTLTIDSGAIVVLHDTVTVGDNTRIVLNGGTIRCMNDSAVLIVKNPLGISGSGTLDHVRLQIPNNFTIPWGSTLAFTQGGTLSCADSVHVIYVDGSWTFSGVNTTYEFPGCLTSMIVQGALTTEPGVTLKNVPDLTGYSVSDLHAGGADSARCHWQFRPVGELNAYGVLHATSTIFERNPDSTGKWAGIFVGYEDARLNMDSCEVRDVLVTPPRMSGAAIHLYGASSDENVISHCLIHRTDDDGAGRLGDGIFLQPSVDVGGDPVISKLRVECTTIDSSWWTGIANVTSWADVLHSHIHANRVGMSCDDDGGALVHGTCIDAHVGGCGITVQNARMLFGDEFGPLPGENRIVENDTTQIRIGDAGFIFSGPSGGLSMNIITHSDSTRQRIHMSPSGYYTNLRDTWWGVIPDAGSGFTPTKEDVLFGYSSIPTGLFEYHVPLDYIPTISGCGDCMMNELEMRSLTGGGIATQSYATSISELPAFAHAGNLYEVYRYLGNWCRQSSRPSAAVAAAGIALALEEEHVRTHPDTAATARARIGAFVQTCIQQSSTNTVLPQLHFIRARSAFVLGDLPDAVTKIAALRTQYPNSAESKLALSYLLQHAMFTRDSANVESFTTAIENSGLSAQDLQEIYGLRRGYYRALPHAMMIRKPSSGSLPRKDDSRDDSLHVRCYPNPFNPSVTIEFQLPTEDHVRVAVYALDGRLISIVADGWMTAGPHHVIFEAPVAMPSGTYLYTIATTSLVMSGQIHLLR